MIDVEVSARSATCALFSSLPAWAAGQYVQFSFSPEWNGLQKTVYISNGSENIERLLARDDEAVEIPTELMDIPHCTMYVGIRGKGGGKTLGTVWCPIGQVSVATGGSGGSIDTSQFVTKDAMTNYYTRAQTDAKIITRTDRADDEFLAGDGAYRQTPQPDTSGLATKQEVATLDGQLATFGGQLATLDSQLAGKADASAIPDVSGLATQQALSAGLAGKADASAIPDVSGLATKQEVTALGATVTALGEQVDTKASAAEVASQFATLDGQLATIGRQLASKADASAIITKTDGDGTEFLASDGKYKPVAQGALPDLSAYATTSAMNAALATKASQQDVDELDVAVNTLEGQLADKASAMDVATLQGKVEANIAGIAALQTGKADKADLDAKADVSAIPDVSQFVTGTTLNEALAGKANTADIPDTSDFVTGEQMEARLADFAGAEEMAQALAGKADKSAIPDVSGLETSAHAEATFAKKEDVPDVSGLATRQEVNEALAGKADVGAIPDVSALETTAHAEATFAKKEDVPDVSGLATKQELNEGLAGKADAAALESYALITDVPDASTFATAQALEQGLAGKADVSAIPDVSGFVTATAMNEALAGKADASAIPDVSGFASKNEIPDVSGLLSSSDAAATYATQQALTEGLEGKVNNDALQYYETAQHAQATYATKEALDAKAETTVTRTSNSGSWGSESTITIAQTNGGSLGIGKRVERDGAGTRTTMTLDGVQLATAADIPNVSGFATTEALNTALAGKADTSAIPDVSGFETSAHAQATYATQQALTDGLAGKADTSAIPDVSGFITSAAIAGMATQTWVQNYIAALDANNTGY